MDARWQVDPQNDCPLINLPPEIFAIVALDVRGEIIDWKNYQMMRHTSNIFHTIIHKPSEGLLKDHIFYLLETCKKMKVLLAPFIKWRTRKEVETSIPTGKFYHYCECIQAYRNSHCIPHRLFLCSFIR